MNLTGDYFMAVNKRPPKHHDNEIRLTLDARKRVSLLKLLPSYEVSSYKAYTEGDKIILEPMAEIPAHELWLYKNPKALKTVQEGLKKKGKHFLGSFAKHLDKNDAL